MWLESMLSKSYASASETNTCTKCIDDRKQTTYLDTGGAAQYASIADILLKLLILSGECMDLQFCYEHLRIVSF